jgi:importin subunit beta-1
MDQLIWALEHTLTPDQQLLDASLRYLNAWADNAPVWLLTALASLAATGTAAAASQTAVQRQAVIQLKNLVRSKNGDRWRLLDVSDREHVKAVLLAGLLQQSTAAAGIAELPQCIQAVAELELPAGAWPELIPQLAATVIDGGSAQQSSPTAVAACLETMGYICETVNPACLEVHINQLLTAIVYGMKSTAFAADVNLVAVTALSNALELASANFARTAERNYIMQVYMCPTVGKINLDS